MKKLWIFGALAAVAMTAGVIVAADHIDSPAVMGTTSDIADLYAFEGANPDNTVFIATLPSFATGTENFDENVLIEFNIDNDNDLVEDLVIQAIPRNGRMYFFGPSAPAETGTASTILSSSSVTGDVMIGDANAPVAANGIQYFAGSREDAFFFDFEQFNNVKGGPMTAPNGFDQAGAAADFFTDLSVNAVVIEVPNTLLGAAPVHFAEAAGVVPAGVLPAAYNVWVTTKRKQ